MDRSFSFRFHDGNTSLFRVPQHNGQLVTNQFMPKMFYPNHSNPIIASMMVGTPMALQDPNEFSHDVNAMVGYINTTRKPSNIDTTYMDAVVNLVVNHIKQYGRLFFTDLCTFLDEASWLMYGFGFDEDNLRDRVYPQMAYILVLNLGDYVKEGSPLGIIPFTSTKMWATLKDYSVSRGL